MKDQKFALGGDITLSIVSKNSRNLPAEIKNTVNEKSIKDGAAYDRALIVMFNPSGEKTYAPTMQRDAEKKAMFENLKASERVGSQSLWLGEKEDSHTLNAYMVAGHQSLMALTEAGVLGFNESLIRGELTKIIEAGQHGR